MAKKFFTDESLIAFVGEVKSYTNVKANELQVQLNAKSDWNQNDETAVDYIKNKPDEDDAIQLAIETELISPIATASGEILTDKNNIAFTL